jgi:hypothetical protein
MKHAYFQSPNRFSAKGNYHSGPGVDAGAFKTKHWPLCCTAALARILPGYVQWMWMKPADGGLAATLYGPNTLETKLDGTAVRIDTKTDYPFNETANFCVSTAKPLRFPLKLRIPEWCTSPTLHVNGSRANVPVGSDGFAVLDRIWKTGDCVTLKLQMTLKVERMRDYNDGGKPYCSLSCGPLLFAHALDEIDENTPHPDVRTDWRLDPLHVCDGAHINRLPIPERWDWPREAPVRLKVKAADGSPLVLVPYGCAKLRVSMFPEEIKQMVKPSIRVVTEKDPIGYKRGDVIRFMIDAKGGEKVRWMRTGDDGRTEKGEINDRGAIVVKTSMDVSGFVRFVAEVLNGEGKVLASFHGGAGVDVEKIRQDSPEPHDFDAFWDRHKNELKSVPMRGVVCTERASGRTDVRLYEVSVPCVGPRPATGFLSIPAKAGRYPARIKFHGYNVIDGNGTDTRFLDPSQVIVGLHYHRTANDYKNGSYNRPNTRFIIRENDVFCEW